MQRGGPSGRLFHGRPAFSRAVIAGFGIAGFGHVSLWLCCITLPASHFAGVPDIVANKIWPKSLALIKGKSSVLIKGWGTIAQICNFGFSLARGTCIFDPS